MQILLDLYLEAPKAYDIFEYFCSISVVLDLLSLHIPVLGVIIPHTTIAHGKLRVPSAPLYINREAPD
jgi:hypothetical protein